MRNNASHEGGVLHGDLPSPTTMLADRACVGATMYMRVAPHACDLSGYTSLAKYAVARPLFLGQTYLTVRNAGVGSAPS